MEGVQPPYTTTSGQFYQRTGQRPIQQHQVSFTTQEDKHQVSFTTVEEKDPYNNIGKFNHRGQRPIQHQVSLTTVEDKDPYKNIR